MRLIRAVFTITIIFFCSGLVNAQDKPLGEQRLRAIQYNGVRLAAVLATLATDYQITIGLEADPKKPESMVVIDLRDVVFRQILDGIVQAEPLYQWRDNNGAIDVLPVDGGLLDARIHSFQLKDVNRALAVNRLFGLPEVRELMAAKQLRPRPPYQPADRIKDEKLSFDLRSVSVRQALNQIAHDSGANVWVFRSYPDGTYEVTMGCC
jgi:hypothetical protein